MKLNTELAENQAKIELYKQAFIDGIVDENIFQKLFTDDPDDRELLVVPELYNSIELYPFPGWLIEWSTIMYYF